MSNDINRRLAKLTAIMGGKSCSTCEAWGRPVVQIVASGAAASGGAQFVDLPRPERCPTCNRRPPDTIAVVQIIAPDDEDAEVLR